MALDDNAIWTVTGECIIDELTIGADASVVAADGELVMTVDGVETEIAAGQQYEGDIVITIK